MKKSKLRSKIIFLLFFAVMATGLSVTYISIESLHEIGTKVKTASTGVLKNNAKKCLADTNLLQAEKIDLLAWERDVSAKYLADRLSEKYEVLASGYYFLLDNEAKLIAMPDAGYNDIFGKMPNESTIGVVFSDAKPEFLPLLDKIRENENGTMTVRTKERDFMLAFSKMKNTGWTLVSLIDSDEYLLPLKDIEFQILGTISAFITNKLFPLSLMIIVLIFSAGALAVDRIARPLACLTQKYQILAKEKFGLKISRQAETADEADRLSDILDSMQGVADEYKQRLDGIKQGLAKKDRKKIKNLVDKVSELEKFQEAAVDREIKMVAMKKELSELKLKIR